MVRCSEHAPEHVPALRVPDIPCTLRSAAGVSDTRLCARSPEQELVVKCEGIKLVLEY